MDLRAHSLPMLAFARAIQSFGAAGYKMRPSATGAVAVTWRKKRTDLSVDMEMPP